MGQTDDQIAENGTATLHDNNVTIAEQSDEETPLKLDNTKSGKTHTQIMAFHFIAADNTKFCANNLFQ